MSWKTMLFLAALSFSAAACKTTSNDNPPATPAAAQTPPASTQGKVDPLSVPAKVEENKAEEAAKTEQGKVEDKSTEPAAAPEAEPKTE
jgi:hypothetical protein